MSVIETEELAGLLRNGLQHFPVILADIVVGQVAVNVPGCEIAGKLLPFPEKINGNIFRTSELCG